MVEEVVARLAAGVLLGELDVAALGQAAEAVDELSRVLVGDVHLARLQGVDAGLALLEDPVLDGVGVGELFAVGPGLPVVGVGRRPEAVTDHVLLEHERPGAHRLGGLGGAVLDAPQPGGRRHGPELADEAVREPPPRLVGLHSHDGRGPVGRRGDRVDRLEGDLGEARGDLVVEVHRDRVGVERRAVVEGDALPRREGPLGEVVVRLDVLEQVRLGDAVLVRLHEVVVDGLEDLVARDGARRAGRRPRVRGVGLDAVDDGAAPLRLAGVLLLGLPRAAAPVLPAGRAAATAVVVVPATGGGHEAEHRQQGEQPQQH
jgi:hypothetical protein